ncbi:MAG: GAF domain-containing protein [Anaerolineae bacterium]|nr:GAF domain-containing protein [Anaerolineae bacterium]
MDSQVWNTALERLSDAVGQISEESLRASMAAQIDALRRELVASEEIEASLYREIERQAQELVLLEVARGALARQRDVREVIRTIVESTAESFGYVLVSLYLIEGESLILQHQVGYDQVIERIPISGGVSGRVVRSGQPILLEDVHTDVDFLGAVPGIVSEICVPLHDEGKVVGILNVETFAPQRLTDQDLRLLVALSEHVSLAIQRARLFSTIQQSHEAYQTLVDSIGEVIYQTRLDGTLSFLNPAWKRITGFDVEESLGKSVIVFSHPDDADRVFRNRRLMVSRQRDSVMYHARLRTKSGSFVWVEINAHAIFDERGALVGTAGTLTDISDRRHAEERAQNQLMFADTLRDLAASFTDIVEMPAVLEQVAAHVAQVAPFDAGCILMIGDEQFRAVWGSGYAERGFGGWHAAFEVMLSGLSQHEEVARWGKPVILSGLAQYPDVMGSATLSWVQSRLYVPIRTRRVALGMIVLDSSLANAFSAVEAERVLAIADLASAVIGSLIDRQRRLQIEKDLRQALERERVLAEVRSQVGVTISHEFRTPLAVIQSSAEMLERYEGRLESGRRAELFSNILRQIGYMAQMIENIMLISQADTSGLAAKPRTLDLVEFCETVAQDMQRLAGEHHTIVFSHRGSLEWARLDPYLLRRILVNLLGNAIKYSPRAGTVLFDLAAEDDRVVITVSDQGIGIPPEDIEVIFETFRRASNAGMIPGSGVGLALVRRAVELHGGIISVTSRLGEGTTFTIRMPLRI